MYNTGYKSIVQNILFNVTKKYQAESRASIYLKIIALSVKHIFVIFFNYNYKY